jgi:hypothetical protein
MGERLAACYDEAAAASLAEADLGDLGDLSALVACEDDGLTARVSRRPTHG